MSKSRNTENQRVLEAAGWELVETKSGKRFWQHPDMEEERAEDAALEMLHQEQSHKLRSAGWEPVELEGRAYWRRPDSGYLYPRRAALYVEDVREGGGS